MLKKTRISFFVKTCTFVLCKKLTLALGGAGKGADEMVSTASGGMTVTVC